MSHSFPEWARGESPSGLTASLMRAVESSVAAVVISASGATNDSGHAGCLGDPRGILHVRLSMHDGRHDALLVKPSSWARS